MKKTVKIFLTAALTSPVLMPLISSQCKEETDQEILEKRIKNVTLEFDGDKTKTYWNKVKKENLFLTYQGSKESLKTNFTKIVLEEIIEQDKDFTKVRVYASYKSAALNFFLSIGDFKQDTRIDNDDYVIENGTLIEIKNILATKLEIKELSSEIDLSREVKDVFKFCSNLEEIIIPNVKEIPWNFEHNANLKVINFPNVEKIKGTPFSENKKLEKILLPSLKEFSKTIIPPELATLKEVNLDSIEKLEDRAFINTPNLETISLEKVTEIGKHAFAQRYHLSPSKLKNVNMPNIKNIGASAFVNTSIESLESIKMPNLEKIDSSAFFYCRVLKIINLSNLERTGTSTFDGCSSLEYINLPNVENLKASVFENCCNNHSKDVSINLSNVSQINTSAFKEFGSKDRINKIIINFPNLKHYFIDDDNNSYTKAIFYDAKKVLLRVPKNLLKNYGFDPTSPQALKDFFGENYAANDCSLEIID